MPESNEKATADQLLLQIEAIDRKLQDLDAANRSGKWITRFVLLLIAVVAIGSLYRTFSAIQAQPKKDYFEAAMDEMNYLRPQVMASAHDMFSKLWPVYQSAFEKEFEARMPELSIVATNELELFLENISKSTHSKLNDSLKNMIYGNLKSVVMDDPKAQKTENLDKALEQIQEIYYSAGQEVVQETFADQITALADLQATIETFETPEYIRDMNDELLIEHTVGIVSDIFMTRLNIIDEWTMPTAPKAKDEEVKPAAAPKTETPGGTPQ